MGKPYSNINIILEKVKKGEIASESTFSFSNIEFARRREVIQPYLHWLDESALQNSLKAFFERGNLLEKTISGICKKKELSVAVDLLCRDITKAFKEEKIPFHFIADLFNFYYLEMEKLEFAEKRPYNALSYKMLEKMNNPVMKILTNHYPLKAMIMVRSLILQVLFSYALRKQRNDPKADSIFQQFKIAMKMPCNLDFTADKSNNKDSTRKPKSEIEVQAKESDNSKPGNGFEDTGLNKNESEDEDDQKITNENGNQTNDGVENAKHDNIDGSEPTLDQSGGNEPSNSEFDNFENNIDLFESLNSEEHANDSEIDNGNEDIEQDVEDEYDSEDEVDSGNLEEEEENDVSSWNNQDKVDEDWDDDERIDDLDDYQQYEDEINNETEIEIPHSEGAQDAGKGFVSTRKSLETLLDELINKTFGEKEVMEFGEEIVNEARETMINIDEMMSDEDGKETWESFVENVGEAQLESLKRTDKEYLEKIHIELKKIKLNMNGIKQSIKKLLDRSLSYFSAKDEYFFEHLFDSESLDGLQDIELLHPNIRTIFLDDVMVKDLKKAGKIDVYIDISDSMNWESGLVDDSSNSISKSAFAKAILVKLKEMDMLDDLYVFDDSVRKKGNALIDVLSVAGDGSTNINKVIKKVSKTGKNSLVITDACDNCNLYDERVYFLGVYGARFDSFDDDVRMQYANNEQMCIFDGKQVYRINSQGMPIRPSLNSIY